MQELFWLLLPVAAASGWLVARKSGYKDKEDVKSFDLGSGYFKGLNYLLNEEPDKAIEVFIEMVEIDDETVETHLALGSLFRRRGEVDRAIRIHQNLIARPTLSQEQRSHAIYELGEDYMKAGLLDRAENLFQELIAIDSHLASSLQHLITIYQQEQDWEKAIDTCYLYEKASGEKCFDVMAQYCCEMAERAMHDGNQQELDECLKHAFKFDKNCVRASILSGRREQKAGDCIKAIQHYENVINQDVDYLPEVVSSVQTCYQNLDKEPEMLLFLDRVMSHYNGVTPMLFKADQLLSNGHDREAVEFMVQQLRSKPSVRGLQWLIEANLDRSEGKAKQNLIILHDLIDSLLKDKPVYECLQCGFNGKSLHWQCPRCKQWNCVKPIKGVEAE